MQNNFEDNIHKKIDGFGINPSAQVWERITDRLPEKKRRRLAFWWWLPVLIFFAGIGFYELGWRQGQLQNKLIEHKKTKISTFDFTTKDLKKRKLAIITQPFKPADSLVKNNTGALAKNNKQLLQNTNSNRLKSAEHLPNKNTIGRLNKNIAKQVVVIYPKAEFKKNRLFIRNSFSTINNKQTTDQFKWNKQQFETKEPLKLNDSLNDDSTNNSINKNIGEITTGEIKKDSAAPKRDSTIIAVNKPIKDNNKLKSNWQFTASIGSSNTVGKLLGNTESISNNSSLYFATPGSTPQTQPALLAMPTPGISFAAGLQHIQPINRKWAWYAGFKYAFLSNHQSSGVVDSSQFLSNNLGNYYLYGTTIEHTNHIHRFDISAGFKYTFNTSTSKPFSTYAGLLAGYQFYNNWLQADARQPVLYYSASLTTKLITGTALGIDWQLGKYFSAGLFYEYSFTTASRSTTQYYLHWQSFGAKLTMPFPFIKSTTTLPYHH